MNKSSLIVIVAGLSMPAWADDKPSDAPKLMERFQELAKSFAEARAKLENEYKSATSDDEREAIRAKFAKIEPQFAQRALRLAETDIKDPAAFDCLGFAIFVGESEKAVDLMTAHHLENNKLPELARRLTIRANQSGKIGIAEKLLNLTAAKAKGKEMQGVAHLGCAEILQTKSDGAEELKIAADLSQRAEAEAQKVVDSYGEIETVDGKLGELAKGLLQRIRTLSIGKSAPEVVSKDLDDKETRLSGFKGKVVVLDIWTTWCGPCKAMIPHEREMVEKLRDKPFQLISISADEKKETLKEFLEKEKMPWTHWWEGERNEGMLKDWGVTMFPTIYVLDAKGVIRYKNVRGKRLEEAVHKLLAEKEKEKLP